LLCPGLQERSDLHGKWEKQLTATVQRLHDHSVVIDEEMNAWAIDFGEMNNVEFVDDGKRETMEADWQGLTTIFREWLPNPQRRSKW
jgi:hypothetical protein